MVQVRGRDSLPAAPGASGHGNHTRGPREEEEEEKQQPKRHLLGTMAIPLYTHAPHTSFIKLEGVDSVGNVRGWSLGFREHLVSGCLQLWQMLQQVLQSVQCGWPGTISKVIIIL